jgi:superfamily II DNA or RNA helicase
MWAILYKNGIESFFQTYPELTNYFNQLILSEQPDYYIVPRLFLYNYPHKLLQKVEVEFTPELIDLSFQGELLDRQKPMVERIEKIYNSNKFINGILQARPGFGKTVIGVKLSDIIKQKTMIITDGGTLPGQWIQSYLEFSNLTESDIGLINKDFFVLNKPVIIANVQTLYSRIKKQLKQTYEQISNAGVGLVIYDEVHTTGSSEKFAKSSILFNTRNIIGLSATPFNSGAKKILMENCIGKVLYVANDYELVPEYYFVCYNSKLTKYKRVIDRYSNDLIKWRGMYNKFIVTSKKWLDVIVKYCKKTVLEEGHRTVVLCFTGKQIQTISEELDRLGIKHRRFYGKEREIDKENDRLLLTTYAYTGKGFNFKELSCLILATPFRGKNSVIQITGRILRDCDGKNNPVVYDLIDFAFPSMAQKDIRAKTKIVSNEFKCSIKTINE